MSRAGIKKGGHNARLCGLAGDAITTHLLTMVFASAQKAVRELFDPALRQVLWKSIGLTVLGLVVIWFALRALFEALAVPFISNWFTLSGLPILSEYGTGIGIAAMISASFVMAILLALFVGPVSAAIAGIFLDDVAEHIERQDYADDAPGKAMPVGQSIVMSIKFFGIVILGNLLALFLLLIPGVNLIAFFAVNGYLLGREYFQFAAMRFHDEQGAREIYSRHSGTVVIAGFLIAGLLAVPFLNLLTPIFGAALMVHLHKSIQARAIQ
ncbi:MAG: sulfate transporter family protein [Pseudomonadota bacterium]